MNTKTDLVMVNGHPFPSYNGEALSWTFDDSFSEDQAGYPKMRTVIRAMRDHRPEQLKRERFEMLKGSFDRMFGQNAKRVLQIIDEESPESKLTIFDRKEN